MPVVKYDILIGMKQLSFRTILVRWLPLAFLATTLSALVYAVVQQSFRQSANDPQIQMAEDAGAHAQSLVLTGTVDIRHSLSPYLVFYNDAGIPTGGNGILNGKFPSLPQGVFDYTRVAGEDRVTWQSEADVRSAIVVVRINGAQPGFVMAGRSLREVEWREDWLALEVGVAWIVLLIGTLLLEIAADILRK